jgi:hypothetical protein
MGAAGPGGQTVEVTASYRFVELTQKMEAFEELIKAGQPRRAAVVAEDIQQLIQDFDPRVYFPAVFANFCAVFAENADALSGHWKDRGSFAWQALGHAYKTDLDRFKKG